MSPMGCCVRPTWADDAIDVTDKPTVVEIVSPSSRSRDTGAKLVDDFQIPSLRQTVIVRIQDPTLIHQSRAEAGEITTRIIHDGRIGFSGLLVLDGVFPPPTQA
jgi:hypothetical protein